MQAPNRVRSIDALRGLIMVLMALDHANTLLSWGSQSEFWGGSPPEYGSAAAFLIRFVTHLCAPGFFFLMGVGMALLRDARMRSGWSIQRVTRFFALRGVVIILLHFAMSAGFAIPSIADGSFGIVYNVLYVLGAAMLVTALITEIPSPWLAAIAVVSLLVPEFVLGDPSAFYQPVHPIWRIVAVPGPMGNSTVLYTFFPWFGLAVAGLLLGRELVAHPQRGHRWILGAGIASLGLFVALRSLNGFGNLRPMEGTGWMNFLALTKYPPSLTFVLFTIGTNLLLWQLLHRMPTGLLQPKNPLLVFGRSPLFFYVVHYWLLYGLRWAGVMRLDRPAMLPFWLALLVLMYPLCVWYGSWKGRKPEGSFWRLL